MLGQGAHGVVRLARHKDTQQIVAVKVMSSNMIALVATELATVGLMTHPNIVQVFSTAVDLDKSRTYMVMEMCSGGELFDRIAECGKLDEHITRRYLSQMVSALSYCHAKNVYHRDLKPENILLTKDDQVKLCDFGLAAIWARAHDDSSYLCHTKCGSLMYAAPEVFASSKEAGYEAGPADVWSTGCIFYAMLSGNLPFEMADPKRCSRFRDYLDTGMRQRCEYCNMSEEATSLLCGMLHVDPKKRFTMAQVANSDFLKLRVDVAPPTATVGKWCELIDDDFVSAAKRAAPASGAEPESKRLKSEEDVPQSPSQQAPIKLEAGAGVNKQLTRSLGWVQLPSAKEKVLDDVASALERLGANLSIVHGDFSDVVIGEMPSSTKGGGVEEGGAPTAVSAAEGKLTIRMEVVSSGENTSELNISRNSGLTLEFHSMYRDVRNELAGLNGWSEELGRYHTEAVPVHASEQGRL